MKQIIDGDSQPDALETPRLKQFPLVEEVNFKEMEAETRECPDGEIISLISNYRAEKGAIYKSKYDATDSEDAKSNEEEAAKPNDEDAKSNNSAVFDPPDEEENKAASVEPVAA